MLHGFALKSTLLFITYLMHVPRGQPNPIVIIASFHPCDQAVYEYDLLREKTVLVKRQVTTLFKPFYLILQLYAPAPLSHATIWNNLCYFPVEF